MKITLKVLQSTQKRYAFMGICFIQSEPNRRPFNARNTVFLTIFSTSVGLCFIYLVHVARTFGDILQCAYIMLALMSGSLAFITIVWKMAKLFEFVREIEEIVNKSEWIWSFWLSTINLLFFKIFAVKIQQWFVPGVLKTPTLKLIYTESHQSVEKWTKIIHFAMSKLLVFWVTILKFSFTYILNDFSNDSYELPYPMW